MGEEKGITMNKLLILGYAVGAIGIIVMLIDFWKDLVENPIPTVVITGIITFIF